MAGEKDQVDSETKKKKKSEKEWENEHMLFMIHETSRGKKAEITNNKLRVKSWDPKSQVTWDSRLDLQLVRLTLTLQGENWALFNLCHKS